MLWVWPTAPVKVLVNELRRKAKSMPLESLKQDVFLSSKIHLILFLHMRVKKQWWSSNKCPFQALISIIINLALHWVLQDEKTDSTDSDSDDETVLGDLGDQPKASEASASSGGCGLGPNPVEVPVSPDSPEPVPTVPMAAEPVPTVAEPVPTAAPAPAASVTSTSAPAQTQSGCR